MKKLIVVVAACCALSASLASFALVNCRLMQPGQGQGQAVTLIGSVTSNYTCDPASEFCQYSMPRASCALAYCLAKGGLLTTCENGAGYGANSPTTSAAIAAAGCNFNGNWAPVTVKGDVTKTSCNG